MMNSFRKFVKHSRYAVAGVLFALSVVTAGAATISNPTAASADSCDPVNIVLCGLDSRSLSTSIDSFRAGYNNGSNNGHSDLKAVYQWAGATNSSVSGMSTSNTKLGTLFRNGDIKVNGVVVGHDAWVSARFGAGQSGFVHVEGDVYARKTTTSFAEASAPVIVHMDNNGNADFAVMVGCGNAVKFPPVVQRHPMLSCDNLTKDKLTDRKFQFHASATAKDTTIAKYVFDFGDGTNDTVLSSKQTATTSHQFINFDKDYTIRVTVFGAGFQPGVTSSNCVVTVHTSPQPVKPSLVCDSLKASNNGLEYTFTARATALNTPIKSYVFTFSDGTSPQVVTTSADKAVLKHTYTQNNSAQTVFVIVKSSDMATAQTKICSVHFTTPGVNECRPGVPVGSPQCEECQPSGDMNTCEVPTEELTTAPSELADTGPAGIFAIFGGTTALGALAHKLILRRKLGL